jgi:hypothetical protein
MYIEHYVYSAAIGILVGMFYHRLTGRNPTWIILAAASVPDIDYLFQYLCYDVLSKWSLFAGPWVTHGDFHNFLSFFVLSAFLGVVCRKYFGELFVDGFICIWISCCLHLICDIWVYAVPVTPFFPLNYAFYGLNITPEILDMPLAIGNWGILLVSFYFFLTVCVIKYLFDCKECADHYQTLVEFISPGITSIYFMITRYGSRISRIYSICLASVVRGNREP